MSRISYSIHNLYILLLDAQKFSQIYMFLCYFISDISMMLTILIYELILINNIHILNVNVFLHIFYV